MFRRKEDRRARLEQLSVNNLRDTMESLSQDRSRKSTLLINRLTQVYDNIRKSENDHRQYRACKLANEMKVFLISDPTTDQAAAALSVNYGYKHDYVEGTALAYQHMLYTSRPNNLFAKYVRKNSGTTDSQTYHEFTTYYFDIKATVFRPALRHFAELFKELPDISEEELEKIITSTIYEESKRLKQNTKYRLSRLFKWNICTDHGMTKNRCGFMHTAYEKPPETRPDVKTILKLLFPIEYGADIMSLCVVGKESLDDLHRMVLRFFSSVPMQRFHNPPFWYQPKFETVRKIWCRDIAVDESRLYILYAINNINNYKALVLDRFFAYLITYRGKKMFASVLESKGWITWIEAARHPYGTYYNFMIVGMKLTEEGLEHVDDIVALFFQFKNMLKERNLRWIFNEFKEVQELKFRFETKQPIANYVRYIAQKMHYSNKEEIIDVLRNGFTPSAWSTFWKPVVNKDYMSSDYKSPCQMRIFIIDKSSKGYIKDNELILLEPECLIPYKLEIVPKDTLDRWMKARPEFELPASNEFIPTMVTLKPITKKKVDYIFVASDSRFLRLWHKQCPKFNLPKLNIFLHFTCSSIKNSSAVEIHFNLMLARLIRVSFHDDVYAAALVNLKWEIDATAHGILVKITGWDNKQPLLLEKIIDRILYFKLNLETFVAARQYDKQLSISELEKFEKAQPYDQAREYLLHLLTDRPMRSEVFQKYSHVTFETFEEFVSKVFSELHIDCFLHGNITLNEVLKIIALIEKKLREKRVKQLEKWSIRSPLMIERDIKMEDNHHYVFKAYNKHHRGTSTKVFYQFSEQSFKRNVITQFIREIIEQHYGNLMEKQSLDHFHVHCRVLITKAIQGLTFLFHSSRRHTHLKITEKVDLFLLFIKDYIKNLSEEDFQKKKAEFILRHKNQFQPKTMYEEATEIWNEIVSANYICNRANREQEYLQEMTLQNVKEFCEQFIHKRTPKLVVHITHEKNKDCSSESEGHNITVIDNIQSFKELCGLEKYIPPYTQLGDLRL